MRTTFIETLTAEAKKNSRLFLITGDLGFGVLQNFAKIYPGQFLNVGVAEQNMTGLATGLALEGRVVFTYSIANFPILRCLEQIRNDVCYHNANVKIVAVGGGFSYGPLGVSHHATEDIAIMRAMPRMKVVVPSDSWETEEATRCLIKCSGPAYFRLDKSKMSHKVSEHESFELGKSRCLRHGSDITLIACGGIMEEVMASADQLEDKGISCRILSMHTIQPLDREAVLKACSETTGLLTIEEHSVEGGLGGCIAETCLESGVIPRFFYRIGLRAGFSSVVGSQAYLRKYYGLDRDSIFKTAYTLFRNYKRASRDILSTEMSCKP